MIKSYYIKFIPEAKVNYLFLLRLYLQAAFNEDTKVFDTLNYLSVKELSERTEIKQSTLNRIINDSEYLKFIIIDKKMKKITLQNNFSKSKEKFILLTCREVDLMFEINDNLFCKYLIYLKYYCRLAQAKDKKQDFTIKLFLTACGYSINAKSYQDKISGFNLILKENGIIKIEKYRDLKGHTRNIYSI